MASYRNVMELIVEEQLDNMIDSLGCCKCAQCRDDIIAFALNNLPPKYVVTQKGEIYTKAHSLHQQFLTDIVAAITLGANTIRNNPRHWR